MTEETQIRSDVVNTIGYAQTIKRLVNQRLYFMLISSVVMFFGWLTVFALKDAIMAWFNMIGSLVATGVLVWLAWLSLLLIPLLGFSLGIISYLLVINVLPALEEVRSRNGFANSAINLRYLANAWTILTMCLWLLITILTVTSGIMITNFDTPYF